MPGRGRPRDEQTDARILTCAFEQLVREGYGGMSMEAVAAEAGVAKTTVYRRFPTKRDLVLAALAREVPYSAPPPGLPMREALRWLIRMMVSGLVDTGAVRILATLLVEDQREPGLVESFRTQLLAPRAALIRAVLAGGIERGDLRADVDPLIVIEMIAGATFGHHAILGQSTTDAWLESLVDHVWRSIEAPSP